MALAELATELKIGLPVLWALEVHLSMLDF
jgi:hypothetical protein